MKPPANLSGVLPWLEIVSGNSPILIVAPHGGRAGPTAQQRANPRINDLYTAELARELARRLHARALINSGMDRNVLDCNRVGQLVAGAPEFLELLAAQLEEAVRQHGRVSVLAIHGWNVIEARIDFGIGATIVGEELHPVGAAVMTASRHFIEQRLTRLCQQVDAAGITPTIGFRYPAGGRHNLLQAFTVRELGTSHDALARIAALAARGTIDALQIELSVAVRWPGPLRETTLNLLQETFATAPVPLPQPSYRVRELARLPETPPARLRSPHRFALEFYDPANEIGVIASVDLSGGGGSRVAVLADQRLAICTADGVAQTNGPSRLRLGPVRFAAHSGGFDMEFHGPMLIVPDATAYTRIEKAFSSARLEPAASLRCRFTPQAGTGPLSFHGPIDPQCATSAAFGWLEGEITLAGITRRLRATARAGTPYLNPIDLAIDSRCWLWACFAHHPRWVALEAGQIHRNDASTTRARAVGEASFVDGEIASLLAHPRSLGAPPAAIRAELILANGESVLLHAYPQSFMALERPGPDARRIYTSVGFARFELDGISGVGMFECSDAVHAGSRTVQNEGDD
jgi:hypothetical protein